MNRSPSHRRTRALVLALVGSATLLACAAEPEEAAREPHVSPSDATGERGRATSREASLVRSASIHAQPRPLAAGAVTEDWPGFLGPRRDARSAETPLLRNFPPEGPRLVWSIERGSGYAGPAIRGAHLVFTHREGNKAIVECFDPATGTGHWRFAYPCEYAGRYIKNSGPRATPAISDGRVYVHGVEGMLHCFDLETGEVLWKRNIKQDFSLSDDFFGVVASPLIHGELLIQNLGAPGGPCVAAFDKRTGELVWGAGDDWGPSCASPVVASLGGATRLFVLAGGESRPPTGGLMVLDPERGDVAFTYPFRSRRELSVVGATPVIGAGCVVVTDGYGAGTAAIAWEDGGFRERWRLRSLGLEFTNPLFHEGLLWAVDGTTHRAGAVTALDPSSGREVVRADIDWTETVFDDGREKSFSLSIGQGSLLQADGGLLCLGDEGALLWLEASPEGVRVTQRARLFHALETWTPLAVSSGLLYVCQNNRERFGADPKPPRLLCYDLRGAPN